MKNKNGDMVRVELAAIDKRQNFWACYMKATYPQLAYVACRALSMHDTTAASERDWSLWGAIYCKSRNRLSVDRAGKLVYIKSNRVQQAPASAFEVMLSLLSDGASESGDAAA